MIEEEESQGPYALKVFQLYVLADVLDISKESKQKLFKQAQILENKVKTKLGQTLEDIIHKTALSETELKGFKWDYEAMMVLMSEILPTLSPINGIRDTEKKIIHKNALKDREDLIQALKEVYPFMV